MCDPHGAESGIGHLSATRIDGWLSVRSYGLTSSAFSTSFVTFGSCGAVGDG